VVQAPPPPDTPAQARTKLLALEGTVTLAFAATDDPAAAGASGDVVWHNGVQRGAMRIAGLKQNDATREQYQLWIFDAERDERYPVDGGVFDVGPSGEVIIPIDAKIDVKKPALFAITVEKPGGVVVSKRERIVLAAKAG
jgi:anti-sigma-K factor RskA